MAVDYPRDRIEPRLVSHKLSPCVRLSWNEHRQTPLGGVPAKSRFCDGQSFGVIYCSPGFETAFLETVVRDQFKGRMKRVIPWGEIEGILFSSRLTGKDIYVIFDRACHKLVSEQTTYLKDYPELADVLDERNIRLAY